MSEFEIYLHEARKLAREAGKLLASQSSRIHKMEFKGAFDPVTVMDRQSEKLIAEALRSTFPDHGILGEEGTHVEPQHGYCWMIDPLDGTTNYAHGLPNFCVSIGLVFEKEPIVGVVNAPAFDKEFYAVKNGGAFLNGKPLRVSAEGNIANSFLVTGEPYAIRKNLDYHLGLFKKMVEASLAIRRFGSAAIDLCHVAAGNYDGYWEAELKPWDAAAGMLIVKEAGGKVTDYQGQPYVLQSSNTLVAANKALHEKMVGILKMGTVPKEAST